LPSAPTIQVAGTNFVALLRLAQWLLVIALDRRRRARRGRDRLLARQHVIGLLHALPTIITVHRPKTSAHRRDGADADLAALRFDLLNEAEPALRRRVAPVGEPMDENLRLRQAVVFRLLQDSVKVLKHTVHAAVGHDAHHVQFRGRRRFHACHRRLPDRVGRELFFGNSLFSRTNSWSTIRPAPMFS